MAVRTTGRKLNLTVAVVTAPLNVHCFLLDSPSVVTFGNCILPIPEPAVIVSIFAATDCPCYLFETMKFGKSLMRVVETSDPEWGYVGYLTPFLQLQTLNIFLQSY